MRRRKLFAIGAAITAATMALGACSGAPDEDAGGDSANAEPTSVNIGWNQPFFSYNQNTSNGNAVANSIVLYMMNANFNYYNEALELTPDKSFGSYEKVSDDPLTVKYTIADDTKWSDGTAVDASDMLLQWAALSGKYNTVAPDKVVRDEETGAPADSAAGQVYFDTSSVGLALVTKTPEITDDGKSITLVYDKPFGDWEVAFAVGVPAHVTAAQGLGITDPQEAKDALTKAIQDDDKDALGKIANFWNTGYDYTSLPDDKALYLSNGAYNLTEFKENEFLTLEKNADYKGEHQASIDQVTIRWNEDPLSSVQALANGELDMIYPQSTADVLKAAQAIDGVTVETGPDATYEHVDLTYNNKGPFDPATYGGDAEKAKKVRLAFLKTIPRQEIIDKLIKPLNPDATTRDSQVIVPGAPGYDEIISNNGSAEYKEVDIPGAQALLKEAGVTGPVDVRFLYGKSNTRRANEYQLIAESAKQAGFNVIDKGDDKWGELLGNKSYDASLFGWQSTSTAVTESDANYRTGGQNNFSGYSDPAVDGYYDELAVSTDKAEQLELQTKIEQALWADGFGVTIFQFPGVTAYSANISNVVTLGLNPTIFYGFWDWKSGS